MNGTPRLRSAYPATPKTERKVDQYGGQKASRPSGLKTVPEEDKSNAPLIPLTVLDAPSQRFYLASFYILLTAWRLWDYFKLVSDQTDSLWLFMKWVMIDGVFLYGLPELRIPWMEWSSTTMTILFFGHAVLNGILMFRIPIPLEAWIAAIAKTVYDREMAVSERRVKPASLLHNSSLILGKQIIHILPEGSAMLNPDQFSFCIDHTHPSIELPIRINQTTPITIEILRIDLDTNANETITIQSKEIKKLKKQADKEHGKADEASPRTLRYPIKQTGLYKLLRVVDESNLEVQRRMSDTLVVRCPSASVKTVGEHKCVNQLSNFFFEVDGTPPMKLRYSKTINRKHIGYSYLTINADAESPLNKKRTSGALVKFGDGDVDVSWARSQHIEIPVNETLDIDGGWQYSVEEIHDASGNVVNYTRTESHGDAYRFKGAHLNQVFTVHQRPKTLFGSCSLQNPIKVAAGDYERLPVQLRQTGSQDAPKGNHYLQYSFTRQADAVEEGSSALQRVITKDITLKSGEPGPRVTDPGVYKLLSISTDHCIGEVIEPSSCLVLNPPEPELSMTSEVIPDKCAGNSVGLLVELDLIGTPPFKVTYMIHKKGGRSTTATETINGMRKQLELKPTEAGSYSYEFVNVVDNVHKHQTGIQKTLRLEVDVKPPASARFIDRPEVEACIDQEKEFAVGLSGEPPWTLEYEVVHNGRRSKKKLPDIMDDMVSLSTGPLTHGGETTVTLTSVTDKTGCKIFIANQQAKVEVRHQKPKASFGAIEGKTTITILEHKSADLPIRLSGIGPWIVKYSREDETGAKQYFQKQLNFQNDRIIVNLNGTYELLEVNDKSCPGVIEQSSKIFKIQWIKRPTLEPRTKGDLERIGKRMIKRAICEGDQDSVDVLLAGSPPFKVKYEISFKPEKGAASFRVKDETLGLNTASIKMETAQAGFYEYGFVELSDQQYNHDKNKFTPVKIEQRIHAKPAASFVNPGRTYSYCKEEAAGDEVIPISLVGSPPFSLELGIKHHATVKPEIVNIPNIAGNRYDFHIPHNVLALGSHSVTLRKVQDHNGCQRVTEFDGPTVRVNVNDIPTISPLESTEHYCVGDRISYALAGTPPFNVYYTFEGTVQKASSTTTTFRRIAERPGEFTITALSDKASTDACRAQINITKHIHPMPSVRISRGRTAEVDIHEGGEAEVLFEFGGTPPFEFTYTRSTNAGKGKRSVVLETKSDVSHEYSKMIKVSEEGTYEVVSIRDAHCSFSTQKNTQGKSGQQLLTFH